MSLWTDIETLRIFAADKIASGEIHGMTQWVWFDGRTRLRFERMTEPGTRIDYYSATAYETAETGTVKWKPYVLLI